MATARTRNSAPPKSNAGIIATIVVLVSIAAAVFGLPGFAILWLGLAGAGFATVAPQLTGKNLKGQPEPNGEQEEMDLQKFRFWSDYRWRSFVPGTDWLPFAEGKTWKEKLRFSAIFFVALGLAAVAYTLPVKAQLLGSFPSFANLATELAPYTDLFLWLNVLGAYIVPMQFTGSVRRTTDPQDAQSVVPFYTNPILAVIAPVVGLVVGFVGLAAPAIFERIVDKPDFSFLLQPPIMLAIGLFLVTSGGIAYLANKGATLVDWQERREARATWKAALTHLKVDPRLTDHKLVGEQGVILDTFEAPGVPNADGMLALAPKLIPLLGAGRQAVMLHTPNLSGDGQPVPGTRHPQVFQVIQWPDGSMPDFTQLVDPETAELALRSAAAWVHDEQKLPRADLVNVQRISTDESQTHAYLATFLGEGAVYLDTTGPAIGRQLTGMDAFAEQGQGGILLYLGDLDGAELEDDSVRDRMQRTAATARWNQRWKDALKQGVQVPVIQLDVHRTARLADGTLIEYQPFVFNQGVGGPKFYFGHEANLSTTLAAAPFVAILGFPASGGRPGERHPQALAVAWSQKNVPSSPSKLDPAGDRDAVKWVVSGMVGRAFENARLARPEVAAVTALTTPGTPQQRSKPHIWKIDLRLYDGVTIADVKKNAAKLALSLNVEWLRITEFTDGCTIVVGANPTTRGVEFTRPSARSEIRSYLDYCLSLDWEQAFIDAKVIGSNGASTPKLVKSGTLPKNEDVKVLTFSLPPGISRSQVAEAREKLSAATNNSFFIVRPGKSASEVELLVARENPLKTSIPVNWEEVASSNAIPFGNTVEGDVAAYDWKTDPHLLILGGSGSGKIFDISQLLPVPVSERFPEGWATVGELIEGDLVFSPEGNTTEIRSFTPVREEMLYDIVLDDGQVLRAGAHHMWKVLDAAARKQRGRFDPSERDRVLAEADRLDKLAEIIGAEVGGSLAQIAEMSGVPEHIIRSSGAVPAALSRTVLVATGRSARVYNMDTVLDAAKRAAQRNGAFIFRGHAYTELDIEDLELRGTWLSTRNIADAFVKGESSRDDRDAAKKLVQRSGAASRDGQMRMPVPFYPADEVLHIVASYYRNQDAASRGFAPETIITTKDMMSAGIMNSRGAHNFSIEVAEAFDGTEATLSVDPYVLGAWLGDGSAGSGGLTGVDLEIIESVRDADYEVVDRAELKEWYIKGLTGGLRELGVFKKKHIPAVVQRASKAQRFAVLQGLMDTDGTISKTGNCEISLSDPRLAADTLELIRGLGIKASMSTVGAGYRNADGKYVKCKDRNRIKFTTTQPVFRLPRKLARVPETVRETTRRLYITEIREAGVRPARCLRLAEADHMHLAGGFVPTHNSATLQVLLTSALFRGAEVYVADPSKGAADFRFAEDYLKAIIVDTVESSAMMNAIYAEVVRRKNLNSAHGVGSYRDLPAEVQPPHIVVVIDEFTSLMMADRLKKPNTNDVEVLAEYEEQVQINDAKANIGSKAGRIAREARSAGVTLILATQKLTSDTLSSIPGAGDLKTNMSRLLLGKTTFGDLQAGLRSPTEAPDLGSQVNAGRGIYETTLEASTIIQGWYEPGTPGSLLAKLEEASVPKQPNKLDVAPFMPKTDTHGTPFAVIGGGGAPGPMQPVTPVPTTVAPAIEEMELDLSDADIEDMGELDLSGLDLSDFDENGEETAEPESLVIEPVGGHTLAETTEEEDDADWEAIIARMGERADEEDTVVAEPEPVMDWSAMESLASAAADEPEHDAPVAASAERTVGKDLFFEGEPRVREYEWDELDRLRDWLAVYEAPARMVWLDPMLTQRDFFGIAYAEHARSLMEAAGVQDIVLPEVVSAKDDEAANEESYIAPVVEHSGEALVYQPGAVTLPDGDIDPFDLALAEAEPKPAAAVYEKPSSPAPMRELTPSELAAERAAKRKQKRAEEKAAPAVDDTIAPKSKAVTPGSFDDLF